MQLIRDLSDTLKSVEFEKILDESIPYKLLKALTQEINTPNRESRNQGREAVI